MSGSGTALALAAVAAMAIPLPRPLEAQARDGDRQEPVRVTGTVIDASTRTPLVGALVRLVSADRLAITDDAGRFVLEDVAPGPVQFEVEQLGYEAVVVSADASSGGDPLLVSLPPLPVVLEGLHVMVDRLEARRRAVPVGVRTLAAAELSTAVGNLYDVVRQRSGLSLVPCRGATSQVNTLGTCIRRRGRLVRPGVYLDDHPVLGGIEMLRMHDPAEVYAIELYSGGRQIRIYTRYFMEEMARHPRALVPVWPAWF